MNKDKAEKLLSQVQAENPSVRASLFSGGRNNYWLRVTNRVLNRIVTIRSPQEWLDVRDAWNAVFQPR